MLGACATARCLISKEQEVVLNGWQKEDGGAQVENEVGQVGLGMEHGASMPG